MLDNNDAEILAVSEDGCWRVGLLPMEYPDSPRDNSTPMAHAVIWPDRTYLPPDKDGGPLADEWRRLVNYYSDPRKATDVFERYVSICHGGAVLEAWYHDGPRTVWYVTRADMIANGWTDPTVEDMARVLTGEHREYEAYISGDVWGYVIERRPDCLGHESYGGGIIRRCDGACRAGEWEPFEDTWSYYGYEVAKSVAREAFTYATQGINAA